MVAAKVANMPQGCRTDLAANAVKLVSQDDAAKLFNVSVDSLQRARVVRATAFGTSPRNVQRVQSARAFANAISAALKSSSHAVTGGGACRRICRAVRHVAEQVTASLRLALNVWPHSAHTTTRRRTLFCWHSMHQI
jgi:hypothetical protein